MEKEKLAEYWKKEEETAHITGWDFSYIADRYCGDGDKLPWDYEKVIRKYLKPTDRIVDIDTGGGEFLLSLGHPYELTSATEGYAPNVAFCREKFAPLGVDFREMNDYSRMPFEDESFDVVLDRHGEYDAKEVFRVLKSGGVFITQQVGEKNDFELVRMLLPDAQIKFPGHNVAVQTELFRKAGFEILEQGEKATEIKFFDTGALVWFAKIIEWEFEGFSVDKCLDRLYDVQEKIEKNGFVSGSAWRFYFVAKKP